jgi:4-hydroxy-L-threonine phosphate dehydrogenase PdxA
MPTRTSVYHGTTFELAGSGRARDGSFSAAGNLALLPAAQH